MNPQPPKKPKGPPPFPDDLAKAWVALGDSPAWTDALLPQIERMIDARRANVLDGDFKPEEREILRRIYLDNKEMRAAILRNIEQARQQLRDKLDA